MFPHSLKNDVPRPTLQKRRFVKLRKKLKSTEYVKAAYAHLSTKLKLLFLKKRKQKQEKLFAQHKSN